MGLLLTYDLEIQIFGILPSINYLLAMSNY